MYDILELPLAKNMPDVSRKNVQLTNQEMMQDPLPL